MQFTYFVVLLKLTVLPRFLLPPEWSYLSLCGRCEAYLTEYSFSNFHSSVECPGPCNKHVSPLVGQFLGWPAFFFPVLASAACVGVGRRGGFSSLSFPAMAGMVSICPNCSFRSYSSSFVDFSATSILSNSSQVAL